MALWKRAIQAFFHCFGYHLYPKDTRPMLRHDMERDEAFIALYKRCLPYTMTNMERLFMLHRAVQHVADRKIPGDWVECGVWRGGSAMMMALTLRALDKTGEDLYLFDTYEGMPEPTPEDRRYDGSDSRADWEAAQRDTHNDWCFASLEDVRQNLAKTGYPEERLHFIKGKVQDTLESHAPQQIALLRLDTDWYASTRHELEILYHRLAPGGILILDDYGEWEGVRQAADEYFDALGQAAPLLHRIDCACYMAVKP